MRSTNQSWLYLFAASILTAVMCGCQESAEIDCQIVGHSMASAFKSAHELVQCEQCGFEYTFSRKNNGGPPAKIMCRNCACQIKSQPDVRPADLVKLQPDRPAKRWDAVAFRRSDRILVKRVIGLPGETVDFQNGNLVINGAIKHKPQTTWHQLSTHVFDSNPNPRFLPENRIGTLMQADDRLVPRNKSAWRLSGKTLIHVAGTPGTVSGRAASDKSKFDFIDYRHWRCYPSSATNRVPAIIEDVYPFNQSIRRLPHRVDELDVQVEVDLKAPGSMRLVRRIRPAQISVILRRHADGSTFVQLDPGIAAAPEKLTIVKLAKLTSSAELPKIAGNANSLIIRLVNYDQQVHLFVNGIEAIPPIELESFQTFQRSPPQVNQPEISIGIASATEARVKRVRIKRDLFLFQQSPKPAMRLPITLGSDQYYVIGDNLPVSEDSRHFGPVKDIMGVVYHATN